MKNPDASKYVIRVRRGKAILVDRQILRWRKEGRVAWQASKPAQAKKKSKPEKPSDTFARIKKLMTG